MGNRPWNRQFWRNIFFAELSNLPGDMQSRLLSQSARGVLATLRYWMLLVPAFAFVLLWPELLDRMRSGDVIDTILGYTGILLGFLMGVYLIKFCLQAQKRWIHRELNGLGIRPAGCLLCHYDLRGTPGESAACPECGAAIASIVNKQSITTHDKADHVHQESP